jgi:sarcosine oxidase subunit gamma
VPELIAKTALAGVKPLVIAETTLAEVDLGQVTSVALFPAQEKAAAKALKPLGLSFPAPNSFAEKGDARIVWTSRKQAFLIGVPAPDFGAAAAVTDQSGGWAALSLSGPAAVEALARYVPIDLRLSAFPVGAAARAPLYHMSMVLLRTAPDAFLILCFRSMARTAWHELDIALRSLAARAKIA